MFETIHSHTVYAAGLPDQPVVVDLGAHRGEFSAAMHARYGGTYYLVEANPSLADELKQGQFPVWHCAVTDADGHVSFNIAKDPQGSSVLTLPLESKWNCVLEHTVSVPAMTLVSLLAELNTSRIDVLKMDIEGAEVAVLAGLSQATLRSIGQITVEFHSHPIFGFELTRQVESVIRNLRRQGFVCLDFSSNTRFDVLLVNRGFHRIPWHRGKIWEMRNSPPSWMLRLWRAVPARARDGLRHAVDALTGTSAAPKDG